MMHRVVDKVRSKVFTAIEEIYIDILFASLAGVTIRGCFAGPLAIGRITNATLFYYLTKHSLVNEAVDEGQVGSTFECRLEVGLLTVAKCY